MMKFSLSASRIGWKAEQLHWRSKMPKLGFGQIPEPLRFSQALEVGQDLSACFLGTAGSEPADDLADGSIGKLDVVIESEPASIRGGIDLPALIVALEEVALRHAVGENFVLDPLSRLKVEQLVEKVLISFQNLGKED